MSDDLVGPACTDPACDIAPKPGFPPHGPHTFRARQQAPPRSAHDALDDAEGRLVLAGAWIVDDQGRVLLLHRCTPTLSQWETPGGKVEAGETPAEAAVREVGEELGVSVAIVEDLGAHDFTSQAHQMRYALFAMSVTAGILRVVEVDTFDEVRAFTLTELQAQREQLSPNVVNLLHLYSSGRVNLAVAR